MPRGSKPGERRGGRQKGVPNSKNAQRIAKAEASGLLPHDFLLAVTRGEIIDGYKPTFEDRLDAAKVAANYFAPKLSSVEHSGPDGGPIEIKGGGVSGMLAAVNGEGDHEDRSRRLAKAPPPLALGS